MLLPEVDTDVFSSPFLHHSFDLNLGQPVLEFIRAFSDRIVEGNLGHAAREIIDSNHRYQHVYHHAVYLLSNDSLEI